MIDTIRAVGSRALVLPVIGLCACTGRKMGVLKVTPKYIVTLTEGDHETEPDRYRRSDGLIAGHKYLETPLPCTVENALAVWEDWQND